MRDFDPANCAIGAAVEILGSGRPSWCCARPSTACAASMTCSAAPGYPGRCSAAAWPAWSGEGLLRKVPYQEAGQRSRDEYRLTRKGVDLYPVMVALMQWGDQYEAGPEGPPVLLRHRDCGEPVRLRLSCRAGHVLESARDVTPVPGPGARQIA